MNKALMKDDGIIRFHGSFSHGEKFSILLEWASLGNLEDFFLQKPQPNDPRDAFRLWNSFMRLLWTMSSLRNMELADGSKCQLYVEVDLPV
jgi:hypothetical protein